MISLSFAIHAALAFASPGPNGCAAASQATRGKACVATASGVVLASDAAEASRLAVLLREGEARFARHFGRAPPPYAIVQEPGDGDVDAVQALGYSRVLPWRTPAQFSALRTASIRRGAIVQAKAQGVDDAQAAAIADRAVAAAASRAGAVIGNGSESGSLPHEAGHLWFTGTYWPKPVPGKRYGGPGPDWMDEMAAVLMEDDAFAATRRDGFAKAYAGRNAAGESPIAAEVVDLPLYLAREHPAYAGVRAMMDKEGSMRGARVMTLAGEEARKVANGGILFYLQSRLFADYLIARSAKPAIFASIGAAFGRGETMERWLAANGRANGLPTTIAALDRDWRAWLAARFGKPGVSA